MEEDHEEDPDAGRRAESGLEEFCFYLIQAGLPESAVYGWHSGWPFDRLERAFRFFKVQEIEKERSFVTAVSIGASSLFSKNAIQEYSRATDKIIGSVRKTPQQQNNTRIKNEFSKLTGMLNGST